MCSSRGGSGWCVTGSLRAGTEIAAHQALHGDGIKSIALSVRDVDRAHSEAVARGARSLAAPVDDADHRGTVRIATIAAYGDTVHTFVDRSGYDGPFLPGYEPVEANAGAVAPGAERTRCCSRSTTSSATSSSAT